MLGTGSSSTATGHQLDLFALPPQDFERLVLWLVNREGFERAEYLGELGGDQGRDIQAWKEGKRYIFQCKRTRRFGPAVARQDIDKLKTLPKDQWPDYIVFVLARPASARSRESIQDYWGEEDRCLFWSGAELDEIIKRHPEILWEFFRIGVELTSAPDLQLLRYLRRLVEDCSRLPLTPMHGGSVAIEDLVQINVLEPVEDDKAQIHPMRIAEAVDRHSRSLIVGLGGSGKSTAIRWLAYHVATELLNSLPLHSRQPLDRAVPVIVRLSRYDGDLVHLIARAIQCRAEDVERFLDQNRVLLLLDGFDELPAKKLFLQDLEQLTARAPTTRLVLTSRPHRALLHLSPLFGPRLTIAPLGDQELVDLFRLHLGDWGAEQLAESLKRNRSLEAFRLPLMACLAALTFRDAETLPVPLATGTLYAKVIKDLLKKWEARRTSDLVDRSIDLKIDCLARLAAEMVKLDRTTIGYRTTLGLFQVILNLGPAFRDRSFLAPQELLAQLEHQSLLKLSEVGVEFWHLSSRDHFAAVWLARHASPWQVLARTRHARWREPTIHMASLLASDRGRSLLSLFLRVLPVPVFVCTVQPVSGAADWIFMLLRCLVETQAESIDLKNRFLACLPSRELLIGGATLRFEGISRHSEDIYLEFYALIGQLRTNTSFEFLRGTYRRARVKGIGYVKTSKAMEVLLADFEEPESEDTLADRMAAVHLLRFPQKLILKRIAQLMSRAKPGTKTRLLKCLTYAYRSEGVKLEDLGGWQRLLAYIALSDLDTGVREDALSFLRSMDSGGLPREAERLFLEALDSGGASARYLAAWPLVYSYTSESLEALLDSVKDEVLVVGLRSLDALRCRDRKHFPDDQIGLLKELATAASSISEVSVAIESRLAEFPPEEDRAVLERRSG